MISFRGVFNFSKGNIWNKYVNFDVLRVNVFCFFRGRSFRGTLVVGKYVLNFRFFLIFLRGGFFALLIFLVGGRFFPSFLSWMPSAIALSELSARTIDATTECYVYYPQ